MEGTKQRFAACLIVRDEEHFLPESLRSVAPFAEEICVLDTGSRDSTVQIAKSFGARVGHFEWCNDFSRARNASLLMTKQPWILVLDADERLEPQSAPALHSAMQHPTALAWLVVRDDLRPQGPPDSILLPRLFRNDPRIRFNRPVHEDISESLIAAGADPPEMCGVRLTHHGYLPEVLAVRDKRMRNLAILRAHSREDRTDLYSMWKLAVTLTGTSEERERLLAYEEAYALAEALDAEEIDEYPFSTNLYAGHASTLLEHGHMTRAIAVAQRGLARFPESLPLLYWRGSLARRIGDYAAADSHLRACIGRECISLLCPADPGLSGIRPLVELARLAMDAGDLRSAAERLEMAARENPKDLELRCVQVRMLIQQTCYRSAAKALHALLDEVPTHTAVQLLGGQLAWSTHNFEAALELWRAARGPGDTGNEARARLAVALLLSGRDRAAIEEVGRVVARDLTTAACRRMFASLDAKVALPDPAFNRAALASEIRTWIRELSLAGRADLLGKLSESLRATESTRVVPGEAAAA